MQNSNRIALLGVITVSFKIDLNIAEQIFIQRSKSVRKKFIYFKYSIAFAMTSLFKETKIGKNVFIINMQLST